MRVPPLRLANERYAHVESNRNNQVKKQTYFYHEPIDITKLLIKKEKNLRSKNAQIDFRP